jgi:hypothetical protein
MSFVNVGIAAANLVTTSIKAGVDSVTDCGSECRALCKTKTGAFFSKRKECKNICKANCVQRLTPEERKIESDEQERKAKETKTIYIVGGLILVVALSIALYVLFKKK